MSQFVSQFRTAAIVGEPEVVEDGRSVRELAAHPAWLRLKEAAVALQALQIKDGSVPEEADKPGAAEHVGDASSTPIAELAPHFPHDAAYLEALDVDFRRWADEGFGVPDFLDSLTAFQPQQHRIDGLGHLVVFPMYTQNGSTEPARRGGAHRGHLAGVHRRTGGRRLRQQAVRAASGSWTSRPATTPTRRCCSRRPWRCARSRTFTWGAIFQDREAARYRRVVRAAAGDHQAGAARRRGRMLDDQQLTEETFVMWDLIHDRSHMRGDLPFDPFMIKQRMPFFLYSLEELRCDLTAFRESVRWSATAGAAGCGAVGRAARDPRPRPPGAVRGDLRPDLPVRDHRQPGAQLRRTRRPAAVRLAAPARRAALDGHPAHHRLGERSRRGGGPERPDQRPVLAFDRPAEGGALAGRLRDAHRDAHAATRHPSGRAGCPDEILAGPPKGYTDAVLDDEFPLSMFYEALNKKMAAVIESTAGITGDPT